MHNHNQSSSSGTMGFIVRHLFLLVVVLAIVNVEVQTMTDVSVAAVILILAHIVAVVVVLYGGRRFLQGLVQKFHGQPNTQAHSHAHDESEHHHHASELETEGGTISWARFYDIFVRMIFANNVKIMMKSTINLANIKSGEKVLDVGCGTGTLAILAKQTSGQGAKIHGIDASPQMIQRAQEKAQQSHVDVDFQLALVEKLPFPDASFDIVMNSMMMHHLPGDLKSKGLAEMYRVLKPGGRLLIVDFEPPQPGLYKSFLSLILGGMTSIDNTIIPPLAEKAGFKNVKMGRTDSSIASYISGVKPQ